MQFFLNWKLKLIQRETLYANVYFLTNMSYTLSTEFTSSKRVHCGCNGRRLYNMQTRTFVICWYSRSVSKLRVARRTTDYSRQKGKQHSQKAMFLCPNGTNGGEEKRNPRDVSSATDSGIDFRLLSQLVLSAPRWLCLLRRGSDASKSNS